MDQAPLVSIITPAFNSERFLGETVASVRAQTLPRWEMIVADDRSSDGTLALARRLAAEEPRLRVIEMPRNGGAGPARNAAIEASAGRYLAFLDADDLWDPTKLERQVAFMQRGGHAFSYHDYRVVSEGGGRLGRSLTFPPAISYRDMLIEQPGCLTVMLDRQAFPPIRFPPFRRNQDGALWLSLLRGGLVAHGLPEELASYRAVETSLTHNKLRSARAVWAVYREQEHLSLPTAASCFLRYALRGALKHAATRARRPGVG